MDWFFQISILDILTLRFCSLFGFVGFYGYEIALIHALHKHTHRKGEHMALKFHTLYNNMFNPLPTPCPSLPPPPPPPPPPPSPHSHLHFDLSLTLLTRFHIPQTLSPSLFDCVPLIQCILWRQDTMSSVVHRFMDKHPWYRVHRMCFTTKGRKKEKPTCDLGATSWPTSSNVSGKQITFCMVSVWYSKYATIL